jgi:hypothetical protein
MSVKVGQAQFMTVEGARLDAKCHHTIERRSHEPVSLFSARTPVIATLAVVIGLLVGLAAGISAGFAAARDGVRPRGWRLGS